MFSRKALTSKITILGLFLLLVILGNAKFKQWQKQRQIDKQKQVLQVQIDEKQQANKQLNESLQYLNSLSFKERVAREQLGLKKQDEQVITFSSGQEVLGQGDSLKEKKNWEKWLDYFFKS